MSNAALALRTTRVRVRVPLHPLGKPPRWVPPLRVGTCAEAYIERHPELPLPRMCVVAKDARHL